MTSSLVAGIAMAVPDGGAPRSPNVIIRGSRDVVFDVVYFGPGRTTPLVTSMPYLDRLAATIRSNAWLPKVAVRGRRSKREPAGLDEARARAVVQLLVERGVAAERLLVEGAGTTPRAADRLSRSEAGLRGVEFEIRERSTPRD